MLVLAADGVTSFSVFPLRFISLIGFGVFAGAMLVTLWALWVSLFTVKTVPGWHTDACLEEVSECMIFAYSLGKQDLIPATRR